MPCPTPNSPRPARLEHVGVLVAHVPRRPYPARQIGVRGIQAVVRHRDGHVLAEIAALVGRVRGDGGQSVMAHELRAPVVPAVRRGRGAEFRGAEREGDRIRAGRRRRAAAGRTAPGRVTAAANRPEMDAGQKQQTQREPKGLSNAGVAHSATSCERKMPALMTPWACS